MDEKYYSVEQTAQLLEMHPKTIQRYIREGKLKAGKLGKSWRISGHDLSVFVEGTTARVPELVRPASAAGRGPDRMMASVVVDMTVDSMDEAIRIANTLTAALNSKPAEYGQSSLSTQFLPSEYKLRILLWGNIRFTEAMVSYLAAMVE